MMPLHDGPPYPILVDEELAGHVVSVWADPDVGIGTFYVYVEPETAIEAASPFEIVVQPADHHTPEATFAAVPADPGEPFQLVGEVDFDRRGWWDVRFEFGTPGARDELRIPVEVTPPGVGRIDLIWFLAPFLILAFLWIKVFIQRRANTRTPGLRPLPPPHTS